MRYSIAAGLAFAVSMMPVLSPAWAQPNPAGTPQNIGSSALPKGTLVNDSGKCWINSDLTNFRWSDCPHVSQAHKGGHHKKG
jgi:hypothetical protein